jgi:hypothetical protein
MKFHEQALPPLSVIYLGITTSGRLSETASEGPGVGCGAKGAGKDKTRTHADVIISYLIFLWGVKLAIRSGIDK